MSLRQAALMTENADLKQELEKAQADIEGLRNHITALRRQRHDLLGLSGHRGEERLVDEFQALYRAIEQWVSHLIPHDQQGLMFKTAKKSSNDHQWFRIHMPKISTSTDQDFRAYALRSLIIICWVKHHLQYTPFGRVRSGGPVYDTHPLAETVIRFRDYQDPLTCKRYNLMVDAMLTKQTPNYRQRLNNEYVFDLSQRLIRDIGGIFAVKINAIERATVKRIAGIGLEVSEMIYLSPDTYQLHPFNMQAGTRDDHLHGVYTTFDSARQDEITVGAGPIHDGTRVYGMVAPALMKLYDDMGEEVSLNQAYVMGQILATLEVNEVIVKAKVMTQKPAGAE
ncbi:hypothetical protein CAC42_6720 [Sphaceloma murrayae]|uniref:Uncharacterized protein n=1 Tax=Sphaceloma murrayae TaxID=2082308 RepID=A0A2K1QGA8_9PEZI|nr:hypothetical protein CAC42_6720 [Sphaceloma murrayae]